MKDYDKLYIYKNYMFLPDFLSFIYDVFGMVIQCEDKTFYNPNIIVINHLSNLSIEKYINTRDEKPSPAVMHLVTKSLSTIKTPQLLGAWVNDYWYTGND